MKIDTKSVLAVVVTVFVLSLEGIVLLLGLPAGVNEGVAGRILGTFDAAALLVLHHYYSSTKGSQDKDAVIAAQLPKAPPQ